MFLWVTPAPPFGTIPLRPLGTCNNIKNLNTCQGAWVVWVPKGAGWSHPQKHLQPFPATSKGDIVPPKGLLQPKCSKWRKVSKNIFTHICCQTKYPHPSPTFFTPQFLHLWAPAGGKKFAQTALDHCIMLTLMHRRKTDIKLGYFPIPSYHTLF